jgi:hypothetical protein
VLVKRALFLLNAALAIAIPHLISQVHSSKIISRSNVSLQKILVILEPWDDRILHVVGIYIIIQLLATWLSAQHFNKLIIIIIIIIIELYLTFSFVI